LTFLNAALKLRRIVPRGACIVTKLSLTTHELEFQKWLELAYENERRRLAEEVAARKQGPLRPNGLSNPGNVLGRQKEQ